MSVTFKGPSHAIAQSKIVRLHQENREDRPADVIFGIGIGLLVWATIAGMAIEALRLM